MAWWDDEQNKRKRNNTASNSTIQNVANQVKKAKTAKKTTMNVSQPQKQSIQNKTRRRNPQVGTTNVDKDYGNNSWSPTKRREPDIGDTGDYTSPNFSIPESTGEHLRAAAAAVPKFFTEAPQEPKLDAYDYLSPNPMTPQQHRQQVRDNAADFAAFMRNITPEQTKNIDPSADYMNPYAQSPYVNRAGQFINDTGANIGSGMDRFAGDVLYELGDTQAQSIIEGNEFARQMGFNTDGRYNTPNEAALYDQWRDSDLYNRVMNESAELGNNEMANTQWGQLMQNLGYNIPAASVSMLLGGAGAAPQIAAMGNMLPMAVGASGSALKEKLDEGYTLDQARRYAALNAINETLFQEAIDPFHTTFGMPMTFQNMLGEAVQEGAGQLVTPLMDLALRDYNGVGDFANALGQQLYQSVTDQNIQAAVEAAKMGALGAGINAMATNPVNTIRTAREDIQLVRNSLDNTNDYERFMRGFKEQAAFDEQIANETGDEMAKMSARNQFDRIADMAREWSKGLESDSPLERQTARAANEDLIKMQATRMGISENMASDIAKVANTEGVRLEFSERITDGNGNPARAIRTDDGRLIINPNETDLLVDIVKDKSFRTVEEAVGQRTRQEPTIIDENGDLEAEAPEQIERLDERTFDQQVDDTQYRYGRLENELNRRIDSARESEGYAQQDTDRLLRDMDIINEDEDIERIEPVERIPNDEYQPTAEEQLRNTVGSQPMQDFMLKMMQNGSDSRIDLGAPGLLERTQFEADRQTGINENRRLADQLQNQAQEQMQNAFNPYYDLNANGALDSILKQEQDRRAGQQWRQTPNMASTAVQEDAFIKMLKELGASDTTATRAAELSNSLKQIAEYADWKVGMSENDYLNTVAVTMATEEETIKKETKKRKTRKAKTAKAEQATTAQAETAQEAKAEPAKKPRKKTAKTTQQTTDDTAVKYLQDLLGISEDEARTMLRNRQTTTEATQEATQSETQQEQANTQTAEETAQNTQEQAQEQTQAAQETAQESTQEQAEETEHDRHVRGTAERLMNSKYTSKAVRDWLKREVVKGSDTVMRTTLHDSEMLQSAADHFAGMTISDALKEMQDLDANGMGGYTERQKGQAAMNASYLINKTDTALSEMAKERENIRKAMKEMTEGSEEYQQAEQAIKDSLELNRDVLKQVQQISEIAYKNFSEHAYALRAAQFLQNMSPEGRMRVIDRMIAGLNSDIEKTRKGKEWARTHSEGMIQLSQELRDAYLAAETDEARQEVMKQIEQSIADQIPFSAKTAINSFRYTMMLCNPATHIRNIVGNAMTNLMFKEADSVAFFIEKALRASGKVFENQLDLNNEEDQKLYSYARRLGQSANDVYAQMVDELGKGTTLDQRRGYFARKGYTGDYLDFLAEQQGEDASLRRDPKLQARFNMAYANLLKQAGATVTESGAIMGKNGQQINLADIESRAYRQAKSQVFSNADMRHSLTPGFDTATSEMRKFASDYFEKNKVNEHTPKDAKYAIRNEITEHQHLFGTSSLGLGLEAVADFTSGALEYEDDLFIKSRYVEVMAQQMNAQGYTLGDNGILVKDGKKLTRQQSEAVMAEMSDYAIDDARKATYHDFNQLAKRINDIKKDGGMAGLLLDAVMPFTTTPMNILRRTAEFTPIGIAKAALEYKKIGTGEITADQYINDLSRGVTGTGNMLIGMMLYNMGLLAVGNENPDKEKYYEEGVFGSQDYAIKFKVGDRDATYTVDWAAPAAAVVLLGAQLAAAMDKDRNLSLSDMIETSTAILDPIFVTTYLSSLNSALSSYQDNKIGGIIMNAAQSYVNQFFPTFGSTFNKIVDETKRTTYSDSMLGRMGRQALNKIPFGSYLLEPAINERGEVEKNQDLGMGIAGRAIYSMSPGKLSISSADDIDKELKRLFDENGQIENKLLPTTFNKFSVDGETQKLKPQEYTKINQTYAQAFHKYAGDFMKTGMYQNMTDAERIEIMQKLQDHATLEARMQYYKDMGLPADKLKTDAYKASELYQNLGGSLSGWYMAQGIKSDKDANGETIKNSKALKTAQFYRQEGTYDDILKLINSGQADPADFGLNKTVVGMSESELINYLDMLEDGSFTGTTSSKRSGSGGKGRRRGSGGGSGRSSGKTDMDKLYEKLYSMAMSGTLNSIGDLASQLSKQAQANYGPKAEKTNHETLLSELEKMVASQNKKPR